MVLLEDLSHGAVVRGILPDRAVTILNVRQIGADAVDVTRYPREDAVDARECRCTPRPHHGVVPRIFCK